MDDAGAKVSDLIFGRWRSQILYAGVQLGVFDALACGPRSAASEERSARKRARSVLEQR